MKLVIKQAVDRRQRSLGFMTIQVLDEYNQPVDSVQVDHDTDAIIHIHLSATIEGGVDVDKVEFADE